MNTLGGSALFILVRDEFANAVRNIAKRLAFSMFNSAISRISMPSADIEDAVYEFVTQQHKLRTELEQVRASARRLKELPQMAACYPEQRMRDIGQLIEALRTAVDVALDSARTSTSA